MPCHRKQIATHLIQAARGRWSVADSNAALASSHTQLPVFPLQQHHFGRLASYTDGDVATPSDFHSYLCDKIKSAQDRIVLASLYIGVGGEGGSKNISEQTVDSDIISCETKSCKEDDLLNALYTATSNNNLNKVQVLLDANRALRRVSITDKNTQSHGSSGRRIQTNSAEAVHSRIHPYLKRNSNGLFLFHVNDKRLCTILPSPLDEVAGVFHIKAYIVDDELILSGANLSEEYFSNRLDRYMLFKNSGGGLVDFYANLCDILCDYAIKYDGQTGNNLSSLFSLEDERDRKQKLESSLMQLFDGKNHDNSTSACDNNKAVAYAIPTFQMPTSFLGRPFRIISDVEVTRNLLLSALQHSDQCSSVRIRLSSAYLNLTHNLMSVLTKYGMKKNAGAPYILTAGAISHGFASKTRSKRRRVGFVDKIKATIPEAFLTLVKDTAQSIIANGGKILLYERPGWTFHAKGIWITESNPHNNCHRPEIINKPSSLLATIIGSGNFGARSESLDVESNCIIVFNDSNDEAKEVYALKEYVADEWNNMCKSSSELKDVSTHQNNNTTMRVVLTFMRRFL